VIPLAHFMLENPWRRYRDGSRASFFANLFRRRRETAEDSPPEDSPLENDPHLPTLAFERDTPKAA